MIIRDDLFLKQHIACIVYRNIILYCDNVISKLYYSIIILTQKKNNLLFLCSNIFGQVDLMFEYR